jgi:hypothetical protein
MGLSGTFTVQASGSSLQYQWSRSGSPIPGATTSTYTTGVTVFSDTGATFTVTVSNQAGSVVSNAASLTITARAPKAGDLRFQQVDAASTINGYAIDSGALSVLGCPAPGQGGIAYFDPADIGSGFWLTTNFCLSQFTAFAPPAGVTGPGMVYAVVPAQFYQSSLQGGYLGLSPAPDDPGSVITSLGLRSSAGSAAFAYIHGDQSSGFSSASYTVAAGGLQALATQEGLYGHVITAISYDGANATLFSYGWTGDTSLYESQVVFGTLDTVADLATGLANEGYIITATGNSQAADGSGVVLVGTRVRGDTMPRPIFIGDSAAGTIGPVLQQGYAVVAIVQKPSVDQVIGER